jgi:hypothetical protein
MTARSSGRVRAGPGRLRLLGALGGGALLVALTFGIVAGPTPASAAIGPVCPVPTSQVGGGLDVCVDRGDDATYPEGSPITVCVSASIPQIAIFPPPPPPTIRVESILQDGTTQLLIEAKMVSGQQCASGSVVEPFGDEMVRAQALGSDGVVFQEDTAHFTTVPREAPAVPTPAATPDPR